MVGDAVFKMRDLLLILAQVILFFQVMECSTIYPSIHWTPENPLFDRNDSVLYILPLSRVPIVCPNPSTVVKRQVRYSSPEREFQNLWIVSRESYERCSTDKRSRLLLQCNTPLSLKYLILVITRFSAVYDFGYIPGKEYYFIATSDGSSESLKRPSGGNCQHKNMKLRIFVCLDNSDPRCNPQTATTMTTTTITTTTTATKTSVGRTTSTKASTKIISTDTDIQAATLSTNPGSTTIRSTNSTSLAPVAEVGWAATSLPTSKFSASAFTSTSTRTATQKVLARASSGNQATSGHKNVLGVVSEMNWIIILPLMACLILSLAGNLILICRLRIRQNEYSLQEKAHTIVEASPVKHLESPKIQTRVEKSLLLFRRSADVSEV